MPKICLNMIVKNEIKTLPRLFDSVRGFIDYWVISDTGSTDGTQEFLKSLDIPGKLSEDPWVDYAHNRNLALNLALESESDFDYILFLDADEILQISESFSKDSLDKERYDIEILFGNSRFWRPMLVKRGIPWYYVGVCHEYLTCNQDVTSGRLNEIKIHDFYDGGNRGTKAERELGLLHTGLAKDPENHRYLFYLAQTYFDIGEYGKAIDFYRKRIAANGWFEEVWYSMYRLALCLLNIGDRQGAIDAFLEAHNYDPRRAEPCYHLCRMYRIEGKYGASTLFGREGDRIPYPEWASLFVEEDIYKWKILDELSISEYWSGQYLDSYIHAVQALGCKSLPDGERSRIEANREFAKNAGAIC